MNKVRIRFSFLLFNALLFSFRDGRMILSFYAVCLLHELGHIAALKLTGGELRSVAFSCFGIKMTAAPAASIGRGVIVLLSGPAVNLLLYGVLRLAHICDETALLSLCAGLFNLLPYSFLDGGAILDLLAEGAACERQLRIFIAALRWLVTIGAAASMAFLVSSHFL